MAENRPPLSVSTIFVSATGRFGCFFAFSTPEMLYILTLSVFPRRFDQPSGPDMGSKTEL